MFSLWLRGGFVKRAAGIFTHYGESDAAAAGGSVGSTKSRKDAVTQKPPRSFGQERPEHDFCLEVFYFYDTLETGSLMFSNRHSTKKRRSPRVSPSVKFARGTQGPNTRTLLLFSVNSFLK